MYWRMLLEWPAAGAEPAASWARRRIGFRSCIGPFREASLYFRPPRTRPGGARPRRPAGPERFPRVGGMLRVFLDELAGQNIRPRGIAELPQRHGSLRDDEPREIGVGVAEPRRHLEQLD